MPINQCLPHGRSQNRMEQFGVQKENLVEQTLEARETIRIKDATRFLYCINPLALIHLCAAIENF
jgi:hypothetical protein